MREKTLPPPENISICKTSTYVEHSQLLGFMNLNIRLITRTHLFQYITVLEADTLVTKEVENPDFVVLRKFTEDGLTMVKPGTIY